MNSWKIKNLKIATILPYKENYTVENASAASLWVAEFYKNSILGISTNSPVYDSNGQWIIQPLYNNDFLYKFIGDNLISGKTSSRYSRITEDSYNAFLLCNKVGTT